MIMLTFTKTSNLAVHFCSTRTKGTIVVLLQTYAFEATARIVGLPILHYHTLFEHSKYSTVHSIF